MGDYTTAHCHLLLGNPATNIEYITGTTVSGMIGDERRVLMDRIWRGPILSPKRVCCWQFDWQLEDAAKGLLQLRRSRSNKHKSVPRKDQHATVRSQHSQAVPSAQVDW